MEQNDASPSKNDKIAGAQGTNVGLGKGHGPKPLPSTPKTVQPVTSSGGTKSPVVIRTPIARTATEGAAGATNTLGSPGSVSKAGSAYAPKPSSPATQGGASMPAIQEGEAQKQKQAPLAILSPRSRQPITRITSETPKVPVTKVSKKPLLDAPPGPAPAPSVSPATAPQHSRIGRQNTDILVKARTVSLAHYDRDEIAARNKTLIRIKTSQNTLLCASVEKDVQHLINLPEREQEYIWTRFQIGAEESVVCFRSCHGRYLSVEKGNGKTSTSRTRKQTEVFTVVPIPNAEHKVALRTYHGEYLCALSGGTLASNRFGPQAWETFEIEEEPFAPPLFGGNLNEIVVYQLKNGLYTQVPHILEVLALHIIRLEGYTTEGIFRISGDGNDVMKLRTELQKGNYSCPIDNVHNAATLFKLFLRELAEPVFPTHFYPTALRVAEEGNVSGMHEMISQFDNINVKVIQFVVNFLLSFLKPNYIAKTMMTSGNMATVFAPTLLRCPSDNPLMQITAATSEVKFVTLLLDKFPSDLKVDITKLLSTTQ